MTTAVTGLFLDAAAADAAVAALIAAGIRGQDISVILESTPGHEQLVRNETDDTPRGIATGAIGGGVLASLAFASLTLPGIGVLATGPILTALTAGAAGTLAGGILGAMTIHGESTTTAEHYEAAIRKGQALVAIHTVHGEARRLKQILESAGAANVSEAVHFAESNATTKPS